MGGIYLITSPLKYERGGCIQNDVSCVLSRCMLSSLLFPSKAYLPGNRESSILKSSLLSDAYISMLDAWYHIARSVRHLTWHIVYYSRNTCLIFAPEKYKNIKIFHFFCSLTTNINNKSEGNTVSVFV